MASVLIVDDSPAIRVGLRRILEPAGYAIAGEAADGGEGADLYEKMRPDLVTMDLEMRPTDGKTAIRRIRAFDPEARVIVISSAYNKNEVLEVLGLGASYMLRKPPRAEKLLEAVARLLSRSRAEA